MAVIIAAIVAMVPAAVMLLVLRASFPRIAAFALGALVHLVPLRGALGRAKSPDAFVGMNVFTAVDPGASPAGIVDEDVVPAPVKPIVIWSPTPRPKESSDGHAKAETNSAPHEESGPRRKENDSRVVGRHHDESRVGRHDRDVRAAA